MGTILRLAGVAVAAAIGFCIGFVAGAAGPMAGDSAHYPFLAVSVPLPHQIPKQAGGTAFRFAMAHDVIHERYSSHGQTYYAERERLAREKLAALPPDVQAAFDQNDNRAAALARLGRGEEAVALLRAKLERQRNAGQEGGSLYTTYANLGSILVRANYPGAASDPKSLERFEEGRLYLGKAIDVNPNGHFGRLRWEEVVADSLVAAMKDRTLLGRFDCLGNSLSEDINAFLGQRYEGRPVDLAFGQKIVRLDFEAPNLMRPGIHADDPDLWPELSPLREHITKVGKGATIPFDEPMLAFVGMWREGGADPHLALVIAETMVRVGQRYIAWTAYERAALLAYRFWPDAAVRDAFVSHCRARQKSIEASLPDTNGLRETFEAELAHGEAYQRAYQKYEAEKIAAGVSSEDDHFYDAFLEGHEPIASAVGAEERYQYVPAHLLDEYAIRRGRACGALGAGLLAFLAAVSIRLAGYAKRSPAPRP